MNATPNTALQRTRLRAPLSFKTFGATPRLIGFSVSLAMLAAVLSAVCLGRPRPSGLFDDLAPASGITTDVFSDGKYAFRIHFGRGSVDEAGLYVYQVATNRWKRVKAISTSEAQLGRSPSTSEANEFGLPFYSVAWHYSGYTRPYIKLPLRTSGSRSFPRKIHRETEPGRYVLEFNPELPSPFATVLVLHEDDLDDAFRR
jgi:hypothetical protein